MQPTRFSSLGSTPTRRSKPRRESWRELSAVWALLCLLPMLLMGVLSQAPHVHELQAMSARIGAPHFGRIDTPVKSIAGARARGAGAAVSRFLQIGAAHFGSGLPGDCSLCQWASASVAAILAISAFCSFRLRVIRHAGSRSLFRFEVFGFFRARAPPVPARFSV